MGHLDKLKISKRVIGAARPRHKGDIVDYRRSKLIAGLEEQIELARFAIEGRALELERKRGHEIVKVRPRLWWKKEPDGRIFTEIRYNKVALNIGRKGNSIEVGPLKKLPSVYRTVIKAVKGGELDSAIENAIRTSRS